MRASFIILILTVTASSALSQIPPNYEKAITRKFPFQVLHASEAIIEDDVDPVTLQALDLLAYNKVVELDGGHLILVHFSGKFLEFDSYSSIDVRRINKQVQEDFNVNAIKLRPALSFLHQTKLPSNQKRLNTQQRGILITNFRTDEEIKVNQPEHFCLKWKDFSGLRPAVYTVTISDFLGETLDNLDVTTTHLDINFNDYPDNYVFTFEVRQRSNQSITSKRQPIQIMQMDYLFPQQCEPGTAIEALEIAYHMERIDYLADDALKYYELAASLSEQPIYRTMLEYYQARRGD